MGGRLITEKGEAMRGFVGTAHCISKMTREQNGQTRVEFAMDQIIQHILELNMRPGDQLPSEYELSKNLGVGRSTLREAIKRLVSRNVLETRQGFLYSVASQYVVLYDEISKHYVVCDIFSIKFVTFLLPNYRPGQVPATDSQTTENGGTAAEGGDATTASSYVSPSQAAYTYATRRRTVTPRSDASARPRQ